MVCPQMAVVVDDDVAAVDNAVAVVVHARKVDEFEAIIIKYDFQIICF